MEQELGLFWDTTLACIQASSTELPEFRIQHHSQWECTKVELKGCLVRLKYCESTDLMTSYSNLPQNQDNAILEGVVRNTTRSIVKAGKNKKPREVMKDLVSVVEQNLLPTLATIGKKLQHAKQKSNWLAG